MAAFQIFHLYGLHTSKDLPLWDEAAYIGWGDEYLQDGKTGSIANAPFYHILYGGLVSLFGVVKSFYAMQYLMKTCVAILFYFVAARFSNSIALSLFTALVLSYSEYHLGAEVLVYYGAFAPFLAAIIAIRNRPALGLAFAALAALSRLEYLAVFFAGSAILLLERFLPKSGTQPRSEYDFKRIGQWGSTTAAWGLAVYVISTISVWALGNRIWFAWSQNFAYFRTATGKVVGINPWLEHTSITQAEFPGATSLGEAWDLNPLAVLGHTWFNLSSIPTHLANYFQTPSQFLLPSSLSVFFFLLLFAIGIVILTVNKDYRSRIGSRLLSLHRELFLCLGGLVATTPAFIVTTRPRYISSLIPIATLALLLSFHPKALSKRASKNISIALLTLSAVFIAISALSSAVYPVLASKERMPVRDNIERIAEVLEPFRELKLLGVSTVSYVNYLGKEKNHQFVEIHAISPVIDEKPDRSLKTLIEENDPDVILVNSLWRADPEFDISMATYPLDDWPQVPLRDGILYLKPGLALLPGYKGNWHQWEESPKARWRWTSGNASIELTNEDSARKAILSLDLQAYGERNIRVLFGGRTVLDKSFRNGESVSIGPLEVNLQIGRNRLEISSREPAQKAPGGDPRMLSFRIINFHLEEMGTNSETTF